MAQRLANRLLSFDGRIGRKPYLIYGICLVALKYAIDSAVAWHFGHPWHIWNYIIPPSDMTLFGLDDPQRRFYLTLWAIAIPFFWIGIALTIKRLRDAGYKTSFVFLFFIPIANLLLFLSLSITPSESVDEVSLKDVEHRGKKPRRGAPLSIGIVIAALVGLVLVLFGANLLAQYSWGLFLGVPFITGFVASWLYNARYIHSKKDTVFISAITPMVIGLFLIGFRLEGLICLLMAVPLAMPFSIAGGLTARRCLQGPATNLTPPRVTACVALVPLLMFAEHVIAFQPPVEPVVTTIVIDAPVYIVWKNVVAFPPLDPPKEWIFQTGIAYPIGAVIDGTGPGAIRRCRFSTGDFVEPITTWDENHLLAFSVASQPPAMHEIGLGPISTPHLDHNYMRSQHGQFRLVALNDHQTLLEGTTWYQDYFWPQVYWRSWSDAIVHRIHLRVLEHVKKISEAQAKAS
jgi:uncharacterized membrane protein YhaH (DUF805 family)